MMTSSKQLSNSYLYNRYKADKFQQGCCYLMRHIWSRCTYFAVVHFCLSYLLGDPDTTFALNMHCVNFNIWK